MPRHIAIIMDGNGRWAKAHGVPRKAGHRQGVEAVRQLVRSIEDVGLDYLTLYGFSSENWNRPEKEVNDLMGLLRLYIRQDLNELVDNGIRVRVIGARDNLADDLVALIDDAETRSRTNDRFTLVLAFNYGGRDEIASAAKRMSEAVQSGQLNPDEIDSQTFEKFLYTTDLPDPDLVIRTSGEMRLSNFLTWQSAYSELIFIDKLWPDFTRQDLEFAIEEFHRRERRFGARPHEMSGQVSDAGRKAVYEMNGQIAKQLLKNIVP